MGRVLEQDPGNCDCARGWRRQVEAGTQVFPWGGSSPHLLNPLSARSFADTKRAVSKRTFHRLAGEGGSAGRVLMCSSPCRWILRQGSSCRGPSTTARLGNSSCHSWRLWRILWRSALPHLPRNPEPGKGPQDAPPLEARYTAGFLTQVTSLNPAGKPP